MGSYSLGDGTYHGFLYTNGVFVTLDFPGGNTSLNGINDTGEIVGTSNEGSFLDTVSGFIPINVPGSISTFVSGINDSGEIVGAFVDSSSTPREHGFIATPHITSIPEPASFLLIASGLAGIIILIVRRRMARTTTY